MESASSNRIYLWSKRFGAILLIAMAIVAAGNAQQLSAAEKGKVKGQTIQEGL
jgi:flagellin-like protein